MANNSSHDLQELKKGVVTVTTEDELVHKLQRKVPLKVKLGMDPTAPDLHLGHAVVLSKLRQFQDQGHEVIFLIGDFTAQIGDPTGKSKTRPPLSRDMIEQNMQTYFEQVGKILDVKRVSIMYNSAWLAQLNLTDVVKLCSSITLARIIEREDFAQRLAEHHPIGFHELLYPLLQGYDSVILKADVEIGGTDQLFNMLMGRSLQEHYGQQPQVVITMPLLEGLDGVHKMSKSLGNAIALSEPAAEAFGKLMSLSDTMMWRYAELLIPDSGMHHEKVKNSVIQGNLHPMDVKKKIAFEIIKKFWSASEAEYAQKQFEELFQKKDYSYAQEIAWAYPTTLWIVDLIKKLGISGSSSEFKRLIEAGAVSLDGHAITDFKAEITVRDGSIVRVGKTRIFKLVCT